MMNLLAWLSCAEIEKTATGEETELLRVTDFSEERTQVQKAVASLRFAIPYLSPYRKDKQGMFSVSRPVMRKNDLETLPEAAEKAIEAAARAEQIENELIELKEEENKLSELLCSYSPWLGLDIPLDFAGTDRTRAVFGTLPSGKGIKEALSDSLSELSDGAFSLNVVGSEASVSYVFLLYMKAAEKKVNAALSDAGFVRFRI